jgi:hypothetical protein
MKVLSIKNLPSRLPFLHTVLYFLALDYWQAPQWLWGVLGAVLVFMWISAVYSLLTQDQVDVLNK